jgi:hypothetical protein
VRGQASIREAGGRASAWSILAAGLIALAGCATPAQMAGMVPDEFDAAAARPDSPFRESVSIERVGGGEAPDPMMVYSAVGGGQLAGALRDALKKFDYLSADDERARFRLQAFLVDMRRPGVGLTLVATALVRYKLSRASDASVIYDDVLSTSATRTVDDAFVGVERARMAVEGAIRANIAEFLAALRSPALEEKAR